MEREGEGGKRFDRATVNGKEAHVSKLRNCDDH